MFQYLPNEIFFIICEQLSKDSIKDLINLSMVNRKIYFLLNSKTFAQLYWYKNPIKFSWRKSEWCCCGNVVNILIEKNIQIERKRDIPNWKNRENEIVCYSDWRFHEKIVRKPNYFSTRK